MWKNLYQNEIGEVDWLCFVIYITHSLSRAILLMLKENTLFLPHHNSQREILDYMRKKFYGIDNSHEKEKHCNFFCTGDFESDT
ncbi:hypothetical protein SNEBB_001361 [Seison nebaliae]|nr:hypothetical protein SNEBB_001361 [Seison nebaliae]